MKRLIYLCVLCVLISLFGAVYVGAIADDILERMDNNKPPLVTSYLGEIEVMEVERYSKELLAEINPYYYYNTSNQNQALTSDQLKKVGGVCWHYAQWFVQRAKEDGYDAIEITLPLGEEFHAIALISTEEGYCILDQIDLVGCWEAG